MTKWSGDVAQLYKGHGADGARLLDPRLKHWLARYCPGQDLFDGGCGTGWLMAYALGCGAKRVFGIDNSQKMVELARGTLRNFDDILGENEVALGDVTATSQIDAGSFGLSLSVNVGCNLDSKGLQAMFQEAYRLLKSGGHMIVTLPANLDVLFLRDGADPDTIRAECNQRLIDTGDPQSLADMGEVFRATIVWDTASQRYRLVYVGERLPDGTPIFRKLAGINGSSGLVVPNNWHKPAAYLEACTLADFEVIESHEGKFASEIDRLAWNKGVSPTDQIGELTVNCCVFEAYVLRKP